MGVWVHCGIILIDQIYEIAAAEMTASQYEITDVSTKYLNRTSDNPGLTSVIRPRIYDLEMWARLYTATLCNTLLQKPMKYDLGNLLAGFVGITNVFDADAQYICNELCWNVTAGMERAFGYRYTANGRGIREYNPGSLSPYVPYFWSEKYASWGSSRFRSNTFGPTAWNTYTCNDMISPYKMEINRVQNCFRYAQSTFWRA
jgi:hypothetical protein